jgi:hypothetical protein
MSRRKIHFCKNSYGNLQKRDQQIFDTTDCASTFINKQALVALLFPQFHCTFLT